MIARIQYGSSGGSCPRRSWLRAISGGSRGNILANQSKRKTSSGGTANVDVVHVGSGAQRGERGIDGRVVHIFSGKKTAASRVGVECAQAVAKLGRKCAGIGVAFARIGVDVDWPGKRQIFGAFERIVGEQDLRLTGLNQLQAVTTRRWLRGDIGVGGVTVAWIFSGAPDELCDISWNRYDYKCIHELKSPL